MASATHNLQAKLDFWIKHSKNVLFIGKHGVGKTAMITDAFDRHGLNWKYFSASTMDPWVDFIGVPQKKTINEIPKEFIILKELASINQQMAIEWVISNWKMNEASAKMVVDHAVGRQEGMTYLDLVRPEVFATGEVEALFFDEYNRSPKKVRNAVMELIQFKSINGLKFPNLKVVWAAINPDDDEEETYDVERLDPAQADRYHITVEVPYKPNADWFRTKYGKKMADSAIQWWDELSEENKNSVSPRRLQYALDIFMERGDMRDVLPINCGVNKLAHTLNTGPINEKLAQFMQEDDQAGAKLFLSNENNYNSAIKFIQKSATMMTFFYPLLATEKLSAMMVEDDASANHIIHNFDKFPIFHNVCQQILDAQTNKRLVSKIRTVFSENQDMAVKFASNGAGTAAESHCNDVPAKDWPATLNKLVTAPKATPAQRLDIYTKVATLIPKKQTAADALKCLEVLNMLLVEDSKNNPQWHFNSSLTAPPLQKFIGIVNHCIREINRNTGKDWPGILKEHGQHFSEVLERVKNGGLMPQLAQP